MDLKNDIKMVTVKFSIYWSFFKASCLLFSMLGCILIVKAQPGSINEPVRFIGNIKVDFSRPDGALPPVIGAHSYQVLRSVKESKDLGDGLGFTFHHHPMLAYWKNQFYVLCNACPTHEERGQTEILLMRGCVVHPIAHSPSLMGVSGRLGRGTIFYLRHLATPSQEEMMLG